MKPTIYLFISAFLLLLTSCEPVDVPDTDDLPPEFSFKITGDGFEHTFTQDEDLSDLQLNLNNYTEYEFTFSGSDEGGLNVMYWMWNVNLDDIIQITLPDVLPVGWVDGVTSGGINDGIAYYGDLNDPRSSTVISGTFLPEVIHFPFSKYFAFHAHDFGGSEGSVNSVDNGIKVVIADQPTELVPRIRIPDTDVTPPTFSFTIKGDGFDHTFDQDFDFESFQLNLKNGATYEFVYTGSDGGGLKDLIWNWPGSTQVGTYLNLPDNTFPGWFETDRFEDPYYEDGIRFEGDATNPLSESILTGKFNAGQTISEKVDFPYHFDFIARDYGGLSGVENTIEGILHILLRYGDHPTELVPRDAVQ